MAKFYGNVGYAETLESTTNPGVWEETITELPYYGDVMRNTRRYEKGDSLNDNLSLNNMISIVADAYANKHFFAIKYIDWMGASWKVTNVEVQRPRLMLTIGGVYSGAKI